MEPPITETGPVLVPLDGSALSEQALDWAAPLALRRHAPLLLVRVADWFSAGDELGLAPVTTPLWRAEQIDAQVQDAARYLDAWAETLRARHAGLQVQTAVETGDAASGLLRVERERGVQLVVMATHGRTGLRRWVRGSVAESVLRSGAAPILLVRPDGALPATATRGLRVLVPLDGSELAERALPEAKRLVDATGDGDAPGEVVLVTVADTSRGATAVNPEQARGALRAAADGYVRGIAAQLAWRDVQVLPVTLLAADVAGAIVDQVSIEGADLVVMATHGRGGLGRWLYGSVADRVAHVSPAPVLLYRPTGRRESAGTPPGVPTVPAVLAVLSGAGAGASMLEARLE
jgi:nucleotide-binding universal stress UspA family protein